MLWLSLGFWTYKDAKRRMEDPLLIALCTLLGLIPPFLGPFIYMLFRPPEYLEDVRERQLEIKSMEERIAAVDLRCPVCHAEVDAGLSSLSARRSSAGCVSCGSPLEPMAISPLRAPIEPRWARDAAARDAGRDAAASSASSRR